MELNRHICTQLIEKAKSFSQITLDDELLHIGNLAFDFLSW